jgi:phytoene/squalene synthetase
MPVSDILFVKSNDPDRFLLSLFISDRKAQEAILACDALNIEIARLRDIIETPHMGYIRLQWWRDEIKKIYAGQKYAPHDILENLAGVIPHYKIPFAVFDDLLSAREADFEEHDDFDFYHYARNIHTPLLKIKAIILGEGQDTNLLAEAYALVGLIRSIPFYKARSQVSIPSIKPEAVKIICNRAAELLGADTTHHKYFKAHYTLANLYINQLKKSGYNPDSLRPLPFKELRLWWKLLCD